MSLLSDFENAKFSTKTILLFYVLIMPLFFISIYLFKPDMIWLIQGNPLVNLHFYFLVSVCLVLSTLWLSMIYVLSDYTIKHLKIIEDDKTKQLKREAISKSLNELRKGDNEAKLNEMTKIIAMSLQEKLNKKFKPPQPKFSSNSNEHYRITLIYSILYLSAAIAINHFWLNWKIQYFLVCLPLFVIFRIVFVKLRLNQKSNRSDPVK
ncbi:hypothetical protein [Fluviicola taffensis]|uniref:hypothetical protein n=1 Tax=Fluviicola taffensis TaxID=191579 RepID=UPI003137B82F